MPLELNCSVSVDPLASVNWLDVSDARTSRNRLAEAAAEIQMTAALMFGIVPPVAVQTGSSASNLYCPADAPTVHASLASAFPLEE